MFIVVFSKYNHMTTPEKNKTKHIIDALKYNNVVMSCLKIMLIVI